MKVDAVGTDVRAGSSCPWSRSLATPVTLFSVIVPLEFHRGASLRCVDAWTRQSLDPLLYEIVLVAPPDFDRDELAELRSRLRPHDQIRHSGERHDVSLAADGAESAKGQFLFFTEAHVWPQPDVLEQCQTVFAENPDWAGFSCRCLRVTHNHLSEVEADMYEADVEFGMTMHPWRKINDPCFAARREPYALCGGFDREFGHFGEWLLAAKYYSHGFKIGYAPHVRLEHKYIGDLKELRTFSRDFTDGEVRFLSRSRKDAVAKLIETPAEWDCRGNWNRRSGAELFRLAMVSRVYGRAPSKVAAASLACRWLSILLAGPALARAAASANEYRWLVAAWLISQTGPKQRLGKAFRAYISAIIRRQRMNGVAAELKRSSAGPATPSTANSILEWDPLARDAFELAGFHPIEQRGGTYFRWSEPIAMVGVSLPAGRYEVSIEFLEGRLAAKRLELFHNRHHLPAQDISREPGRITAAIDMAQSGYSRLAWACRRFHAPRDSRWLGVPVTKITWRPVPG